MFSSKTDDWSTPPEVFEELNNRYGFTLDVCADESNAKCTNYFTAEMDGLKQEWHGRCWMNPPYGRGIGEWVKKAWSETVVHDNCEVVVALLPARTDTKWFHDYIYNMMGVSYTFVRGRLKFGDSKNAAPFPSMIVVFSRTVKELI